MSKMKVKRNISKLLVLLVIALVLGALGYFNEEILPSSENSNLSNVAINIDNIPDYSGEPYIYINNNVPCFNSEELNTKEVEYYSELDAYGRCGVVYANICKNIMPADDEERESISHVIPSGWKQVAYKGIVEGNYLYNRCHLIGYQLAGENANECNLITGTRYMNTEGMLPFENMVAEYIDNNPDNHVLYRVTPIFKGNNLVASGVQMEAFSVEDNGNGICFNIYVYNVQPGVEIDYSDGSSQLAK